KGFGEILLYHIKELFSTKNNIQNPLCYYISHSLGIKKWGVTSYNEKSPQITQIDTNYEKCFTFEQTQ
ncbi:MAG: hypothetical protein PVH61_34225, partial [Candidatus Aminicenantes bacterium]